jgi:hypothetical protein
MNAIDLDEARNRNSLSEVWDALGGTILHVMEDGSDTAVNVANAIVRHIVGGAWLYCDDTDGFSIVSREDVESYALATEDDPRVRNQWDGRGNVLRDGVRIGESVDGE